MVGSVWSQVPTPTPTPRTKQETIVYEEIQLDESIRAYLYIDEDTGEFRAVLSYRLKRDIGGFEDQKRLIAISHETQSKIKEALAAIIEDANSGLGFKREQR